jgi:hypothetical protein
VIARSILVRGEVGGPTWGRYYDPATRSVVIGTGVGSSTANSGAGQSKGDHIDAGAGDDWVVGSDAADTVLGGQGSDVLDGGSGINNLFGGAGNDTYWVRTADLAQAAPPEGQQPTARTVIKDTEGRNIIRLDALRQNVELVQWMGDELNATCLRRPHKRRTERTGLRIRKPQCNPSSAFSSRDKHIASEAHERGPTGKPKRPEGTGYRLLCAAIKQASTRQSCYARNSWRVN